jgi:uncharacterized protein YllA (UPF0747 family)
VGTRTFQPTTVPFSAIPDATPLFLDYTGNWSRVARFYEQAPSLESVAAFARSRPKPDARNSNRLCAALDAQQARWGASRRGVEKLRAGAVAVVTGQQPGLFTGPLYAVLKAISAIKLVRAIEARGIPATAVFWIASEDHDHEEIRWATVLDRDGAPRRIGVELAGAPDSPVGWTRYGGDIRRAVSECIACLPESEFVPEIAGILGEAYVPEASPVDAFGRAMARLFAPFDLTFVDPLDPELTNLAEPVLEEAARRNESLRAAVLERGRELTAAGYHEQVRVTGTSTGLFAYEGKVRRVLKPDDIRPGLALSPNALLRPVVQDALFPTAAYVGGPAEIAYFAQASAIYRALHIPMPPAVPRMSATLVDPRISRALEACGLNPADSWQGRAFIEKKAGAGLSAAPEFDRVRDAVGRAMESLRPHLVPVDATLSGALDTSVHKMLHQVEALRSKYVGAEARRGELFDRRLDSVLHALYPEKKLQERCIGIVSFLARYGTELVSRLEARMSLDDAGHRFLGVD